MCGIAGFWQQKAASTESLSEVAAKMNATLVHRGPDDGGEWVDAARGIALCHRRLSIIDLSPSGHQPMTSSCGRHVIVFNGEIYNFGELRHDLEKQGRTFRGSSDTEVLLEGLAAWGPEETLKRSNGMFAFAVWDRQQRQLTLARDHIGIKPLYYGWAGQTFLFASEPKAFTRHPDFQGRINNASVGLLLKYGYIPAPHSIWKGIHKLPPGHLLVVKTTDSKPDSTAYWSIGALADSGNGCRDEHTMQEELHALLRDSIRLQMVADVPVGAFLSGGVDSSAVVALMQSQCTRRVGTFAIVFDEKEYNEADHARLVAEHLGTEHKELRVSPADALAVIPRLPSIFDEPFADSSQIPTLLVAQLTRRHVTVCLSGDGGDELFAGYAHYPQAQRRWRTIRRLPAAIREGCGRMLGAVEERHWNRLLGRLQYMLPKSVTRGLSAYKLQRFGLALRAVDATAFYDVQVSKWLAPQSIMASPFEENCRNAALQGVPRDRDVIESMACFDILSYLPEDVLTKVDRTSMTVALEARVPLLDHRIVTLALGLPTHLKLRDGESKWLLRRILYQYVPPKLIERPKMGFRVPVAQWLRGPLRSWAEDLLDSRKLEQTGYLVSAPIRAKWREHVEGKQNWEHLLWSVLMFQAWHEHWAN